MCGKKVNTVASKIPAPIDIKILTLATWCHDNCTSLVSQNLQSNCNQTKNEWRHRLGTRFGLE